MALGQRAWKVWMNDLERLLAPPVNPPQDEPPDSDFEAGSEDVDTEEEVQAAAESAAPPAAPPPPERAARAATSRETAGIVELHFPNDGIIRYNPRTKNMQAFCPWRDGRHPDCRRTRTVVPKSDRASGRPLGALAAWILQHDTFDSRLSHIHLCEPSLAERQEARRFCAALPGFADLAILEKDADNVGFDVEPSVP